MSSPHIDYLFDDSTGEPAATDFSDLHGRRFLRVRTTLTRADYIVVQVYDFGAVNHQSNASEYYQQSRAVLTLHFSGNSLGSVKYEHWRSSMPVEEYLKKSLLSRSSSRTFAMSDSQEYKWTSDTSLGHTWTCFNAQRYLVAHYDVRGHTEPQYPNSSGNTLTVSRTFMHLTIEIVTSLILMRYIAKRP
ncbi:hypothetical protein JB92DRAFT_2808781 [Gautieria morchelliformis]|nr:hypothetical protein JB92DRAFT_2808781 [Gautieria morchelliformis]